MVYNARNDSVRYDLEGSWNIAVFGDSFEMDQGVEVNGMIKIPAISMMVAYQI